MKYGFIGLGNMAGAIIRGMAASGKFPQGCFYGYDAQQGKAESLAQAGLTPCESVAALAEVSDLILLAVKPQILPLVLPELEGKTKGKLVASIAAGKELAFYEKYLGSQPLVRVMPNINAKVLSATSAITGNAYATRAHIETVKEMFSTIGSVIELSEAHFPTFSAIAGASPAFAYLYIDELARSAVKAGMPKAQALEIAASTVLGSAKMVLQSGEHPYALVDQVCSPGGTTIEGVMALQELGFAHAVHVAVEAVIEKDKSLKG